MATPTAAPAPVNVPASLARITAPWQPHRVATVNDHELKAVRLLGSFVWHDHEVDELFYVLSGDLIIDVRDGGAEPTKEDEASTRAVALGPGDVFVVPAHMQHRPRAEKEVTALIFETKGVVNTGKVGGALTSKVHELE